MIHTKDEIGADEQIVNRADASDFGAALLAATALKEKDMEAAEEAVEACSGAVEQKDTNVETAAPSAGQPLPPAKRTVPPTRRSGRALKQPRRSFPPQSATVPTQRRPSRAPVDNAAAFNTDGITIGQELLALGLSPSGERVWYRATVTALRKPPSWPPIVVKV